LGDDGVRWLMMLLDKMGWYKPILMLSWMIVMLMLIIEMLVLVDVRSRFSPYIAVRFAAVAATAAARRCRCRAPQRFLIVVLILGRIHMVRCYWQDVRLRGRFIVWTVWTCKCSFTWVVEG